MRLQRYINPHVEKKKALNYYIVDTPIHVLSFASLEVSGLLCFSMLVEGAYSSRWILFPSCLPGCPGRMVWGVRKRLVHVQP